MKNPLFRAQLEYGLKHEIYNTLFSLYVYPGRDLEGLLNKI